MPCSKTDQNNCSVRVTRWDDEDEDDDDDDEDDDQDGDCDHTKALLSKSGRC